MKVTLGTWGVALFLAVFAGGPAHASVGAQEGIASFYGHNDGFHGGKTASGERYDKNSMTAAHRTAKFGTRMRVTNLSNGKSVVVRINNRGPYIRGRVIDLSVAAARQLGFFSRGITRVRVEPVAAGTAVSESATPAAATPVVAAAPVVSAALAAPKPARKAVAVVPEGPVDLTRYIAPAPAATVPAAVATPAVAAPTPVLAAGVPIPLPRPTR
jgi:rare lipoprotein A (peptidoglycan hydrolase)